MAEELSGNNTADQKNQTVCPVCSWTPEKIRKHDGKVGCPACYQTFDKLIKEAVSQVQRGALHLGKRPHGVKTDSPAVKRNEIDSLKKELQNLIAREEYEAAALCRDRINILKAELENLTGEEK
jgi:protein arginine kinase activator